MLWVVITFGGLCAAALGFPTVPTPVAQHQRIVPAHLPCRWAGSWRRSLTRAVPLTPAMVLALLGLAPYVGVRSHPAFAMFSNLRIEGNVPNHWLMRAYNDTVRARSQGIGTCPAVEILQTDLPAVRHMQVNLAPLLPRRTLATFARVGVSAEMYISRWRSLSCLTSS